MSKSEEGKIAVEFETIPKKTFLPEHYTEQQEPFFQGNGNHSVLQLEEICQGYKEYAHQGDIAFYACSRNYAALLKENQELRAELSKYRVGLMSARGTLQALELAVKLAVNAQISSEVSHIESLLSKE